MKIRDFFEHHGILGNPFSEEDAQNDVIFKTACVTTSFHSAWDKIYGNPAEPATSIVFGEKGSGKTALRLQIVKMLGDYNVKHPDARPLVIDYSDLNPFIDRFRHRFSPNKPIQKVLGKWELWDHLDAVLSLGVTQLIDRILEPDQARHSAADTKPLPTGKLNRHQVRDLLLLACCYDTSRSENTLTRWKHLARKLRYGNIVSFFKNRREWSLGIAGSLLTGSIFYLVTKKIFPVLLNHWFWLILAVLFVPLLVKMAKRFWQAWKLKRSLRVLPHTKGTLYKVLMRLQKKDFTGMPFPVSGSTDHRYEMLAKLLGAGETLGLNGIIVLMDRVDEPYLINGSAELMKLIVWSIFDNKLLKHERIGLKLLLPDQLLGFIEREGSEFHQRARLDKQNMIRSLDWTGESLFDLTNVRLRACAAEGKSPAMTDFFESAIDRRRLTDAFAKLKVPRHLFKFLYLLLQKHVNDHTDTEPVWQISAASFESVLALYLRDREAAERNLGVI